jgi:hypothetical protein
MKKPWRPIVVLALLLALLQQALLSLLPAIPAGTCPAIPVPADMLESLALRLLQG